MKWYKITLSAEEVVSGKKEAIRMQFDVFLKKAGNPKDAVLFVRGLGKEEVEVFISPKAAELATTLVKEYSAIECERPAKDNLYLLLGSPQALDILL